MDRRSFVALAAALPACQRSSHLSPPALPMTIAGWRRDDWQNASPAEAPPPVAAQKVLGGFRTRFTQSSRTIAMNAWAMGSDASAFEVQQKWRHTPGVVTFHHGWWFLTLEGGSSTNDDLIRFARDVETALPTGR